MIRQIVRQGFGYYERLPLPDGVKVAIVVGGMAYVAVDAVTGKNKKKTADLTSSERPEALRKERPRNLEEERALVAAAAAAGKLPAAAAAATVAQSK